MPQVPVLVENRQTLTPLSGARFDAPDIGAGGRMLGEGARRLARGAQEAARDFDDIDTIYAEARAKKADVEYQNEEREALFGEDDGYYLKKNDDAVNARPVVLERLAKKRAELLAQAQNPKERMMLEGVLNRRGQETANGVARYAQGQALSAWDVASLARIASAKDSYTRFEATDPEIAASHRDTILSETMQRADKLGINDANAISQMRQDALTELHTSTVNAKMLGDPKAAATYLDKHRGEIDPDKAVELDRQLRPLVVADSARAIASEIAGLAEVKPVLEGKADDAPGAPREVSDTSAIWSAMIHTESRGRQSAVSPKGAIGIAQVMPATAREVAAEMGIPFDEDRYKNDAIYNERLGRFYFNKMLRTFGGDIRKAVAAYNAGPGGVQRAVARGGVEWETRLPNETKGYLAKVLGSKGGVAVAPSDGSQAERSLAAQLETVDATVEARMVGSPPLMVQQVKDATRAEIKRRYEEKKIVTGLREDAAWDDAQRAAFALQDGFTSITQIPGYQNLPIERQRQLDDWADANRAAALGGGKQETDWGFYTALQTMTPEERRALPPSEVRKRLGDAEYKEFAKDLKPDKADPGKQFTFGQITTITKQSLQAAGFAVGDSKAARIQQPRVNEFLRDMTNWAKAIREETGKWPDADAIRRQGDKLLITGRIKVEGEWTDGFAFEAEDNRVVPTMTSRQRSLIVEAFRQERGREPSEREITREFIRGKGTLW